MCLVFNSESQIVCAGHDMNPMLFGEEGGSWSFKKTMDQKEAAATGGPQKSGFSNARSLFEAKSSQGTSNTASAATHIKTKHEGAITCMEVAGSNKISTTGLDGRLAIWSL
jgi:hypothetical protein